MTALRKSEELAVWIERAFGYRFLEPSLSQVALTHRSADGDHNERLEFLGDSVLNCCVARMLFEARPDADEGALSRLRASLVSGATLAEVAGQLSLGDYLRLGSGELKSGGFRRASILADALEALIGAIFVDGGFEAAGAAVKRLFAGRLAALPAAVELKDPKTRLQEALQAQGAALPVYSLITVEGEPHLQSFVVGCEVAAYQISSQGEGSSRRAAEQQAASRALDRLPAKVRLFS
ncbi:MAG TPA: ribonuclease III [Steroidobacteraceae bacterium]